MLKRADTIKTTCSQIELIEGFINGWRQQFNEIPEKKSVGVLLAQHNLETGFGSHCFNWNLGNVKAADDPNEAIDYCILNGVWEILNGKRVALPPENPGSWFRSFDTLADGVAFYLDFLKNHKYKNAWSAIESGCPEEFSHFLKIAKYYTASEEEYTKSIVSLFNEFMNESTFESVLDKIIF